MQNIKSLVFLKVSIIIYANYTILLWHREVKKKNSLRLAWHKVNKTYLQIEEMEVTIYIYIVDAKNDDYNEVDK